MKNIIKPPYRRLQIYTLDPSASTSTDLAVLSRAVIGVRYEELEDAGPLGEYIEVIDYDPATGFIYEPVDLNEHLATDGLEPSVANPQFHQQMVYAVAMNTISTFERVLGRPVIWSGRRRLSDSETEDSETIKNSYVRALRIYPHAMRQDNAYYSPARKALLFGYFIARPSDTSSVIPGSMVFTCLSHDIIVHEMTHAILDSIHPKLLYSSNTDMLAFHEGFSDIVAIFHHFQLPDLLLNEIENTRGDLSQNNLLATLAIQFARATGKGETLRNVLGIRGTDGQRVRSAPDALRNYHKPHERGAVLVAAVFDAYLLIYNQRVKDLRRIATNGTGVLPEGDIHPDLARRFANEAMKTANRVLAICIRAIDYVPPVDLTFGEYLRALLTADREAVPNDRSGYRIAFMEAFREKGIYPHNVRALSEETLLWRRFGQTSSRNSEDNGWLDKPNREIPSSRLFKTLVFTQSMSDTVINELVQSEKYENGEFDFDKATQLLLKNVWIRSDEPEKLPREDDAPIYREMEFRISRTFSIFVEKWIMGIYRNVKGKPSAAKINTYIFDQFGLDFSHVDTPNAKFKFQVLSVRKMLQPRPGNVPSVQLAITMVQRVLVPLWKPDFDIQSLLDENGRPTSAVFELDRNDVMTDSRLTVNEDEVTTASDDPALLKFFFRSGCTLIVDPEKGKIRYAIRKSSAVGKSDINDQSQATGRLMRQAQFYRDQLARYGDSAIEQFVLSKESALRAKHRDEFACIHQPTDHSALY